MLRISSLETQLLVGKFKPDRFISREMKIDLLQERPVLLDCWVNGNELGFNVKLVADVTTEEIDNPEYYEELRKYSKQLDFNSKLDKEIKVLEEEYERIKGKWFTAKRRNSVLNQINELSSQKQDTIIQGARDGITYIYDYVTNKQTYQFYRRKVAHQRLEAVIFNLINGKPGKGEYVDVTGQSEHSIIPSLQLFPLSHYAGKYDEWNETFKHQGTKLKIHRASIEGGTAEDVIQLIEGLA